MTSNIEPSQLGRESASSVEMKAALWVIPIVLVGLLAAFVYIGQVQSASPAVIILRQIVLNGGYWFIPTVLIGLWLGLLIGAVRGVSLGIGVSLFSLGACHLALPVLPNTFIFYWLNPPMIPPRVMDTGGLIGGLLDRPRGTAAYWEDSLSVKLALIGVGVGFVLGFCAFTLFVTARIR